MRRSVVLLQEAAPRNRKGGSLRAEGGAFVSGGMPLVQQVSADRNDWERGSTVLSCLFIRPHP